MPMPQQPAVEVVALDDHVRLVCHSCPDRRRLPLDDLALRVGVAAFVDEHTTCGPLQVQLPADAPQPLVSA